MIGFMAAKGKEFDKFKVSENEGKYPISYSKFKVRDNSIDVGV